MKKLTDHELAFLKEAHDFLENGNFLIKLTNAIGKPIEIIHNKLPEKASKFITKNVNSALQASLKTAMKTLKVSNDISFEDALSATSKKRWLHGSLCAASGGVCGFFGEVGLLADIPITTTLMMRNTASIANGYGFGEDNAETALQCLYVFTLGSKSEHDDEMDTAYYTSRVGLQALIKESSEFIAVNTAKVVLENVEKGTAPQLIRFIARVASYFEVTVTEKMIAESLPIIGALGGATINSLFCDYFGRAAKFHFGILKLENIYGKDIIQKSYDRLTNGNNTKCA